MAILFPCSWFMVKTTRITCSLLSLEFGPIALAITIGLFSSLSQDVILQISISYGLGMRGNLFSILISLMAVAAL